MAIRGVATSQLLFRFGKLSTADFQNGSGTCMRIFHCNNNWLFDQGTSEQE